VLNTKASFLPLYKKSFIMPGLSPTATRLLVEMIAICWIVCLSACENSKGDTAVIKSLDERLKRSNTKLEDNSITVMASLEAKLADPATREKAENWYPKAQRVWELSKNLVHYIGTLKRVFKKDAGYDSQDDTPSGSSDREHAGRFFIAKGKGKELYDSLRAYRNNLLAVDLKIRHTFSEIMQEIQVFDSTGKARNDFSTIFFRNVSSAAAIAVLTSCQNAIREMESKVIAFCDEQSTPMICGFSRAYEHIVGQSSKYLKAGQRLEISAGVAAFNTEKNPTIIINGRHVKLNEKGLANYSLKAPSVAGKYRVPVSIEYVDEYGEKIFRKVTVDYEVAVECDQ
jgi:hypothetical protein